MRNFDSSAPGAHWLRPKLATILFSALQSVACEAQGEWGRGAPRCGMKAAWWQMGEYSECAQGEQVGVWRKKQVLSCEHGAASGRQRPLHG